jgi:hypothetical protein
MRQVKIMTTGAICLIYTRIPVCASSNSKQLRSSWPVCARERNTQTPPPTHMHHTCNSSEEEMVSRGNNIFVLGKKKNLTPARRN